MDHDKYVWSYTITLLQQALTRLLLVAFAEIVFLSSTLHPSEPAHPAYRPSRTQIQDCMLQITYPRPGISVLPPSKLEDLFLSPPVLFPPHP